MMKRLWVAGWSVALAGNLLYGTSLTAQELTQAQPLKRVAVTDRHLYVLRGDRLYAYDASTQKLVSTAVVPGIQSQAVAGARSETQSPKRKAGKRTSKDLALQGLERSANSGNPTGEHARKAREKARQKAREKAAKPPRDMGSSAESETTGSSGTLGAEVEDAGGTQVTGGRFGTLPQLAANGRMVFVVNGAQVHIFEAGTLRPLGSRPLSFENPDSEPRAESSRSR